MVDRWVDGRVDGWLDKWVIGGNCILIILCIA